SRLNNRDLGIILRNAQKIGRTKRDATRNINVHQLQHTNHPEGENKRMRHTGILLSGALASAIAISGVANGLSPAGGMKSGVAKGGVLSAFEPYHVSGADKNTETCPVCKYPTNPAVQVWVNTDDAKNVAAI